MTMLTVSPNPDSRHISGAKTEIMQYHSNLIEHCIILEAVELSRKVDNARSYLAHDPGR
jgi:hypothetical protein